MYRETIWQTLSWRCCSAWRWSSARLARRCRTALRLAGEAVLIAGGALATAILLALGCAATAAGWLSRFLPLTGARECRVPGWRPSDCDTTRLQSAPPLDTTTVGYGGLDTTRRAEYHKWFGNCPGPECQAHQHQAADRPAASDGDV